MMSDQQNGKRVFWKSRWLWVGVILGVYLLIVGIEETVDKKLRGEWTTSTKENSLLLSDEIYVLVTDEKGQVWIGTKKGLYVISPDGMWTAYTKENSNLLNDEIQALAIDKTGRTWVGTADGLYVVDPNGGLTLYKRSSYENSTLYIKALAIDNRNRVWVGSFAGVSVFDENGVETIYTEHNSGLIDNSVKALAVDRFERIWIGTVHQGVSVLDRDGHWITYQENRSRWKMIWWIMAYSPFSWTTAIVFG